MDARFNEDLIAELAAINMALIKALVAVVRFVEREGVPAKTYIGVMLEAGDRDMGATNFWSIPQDRREAVAENARARYADILASVSRAVTQSDTSGKPD